MLPGSGMEPSDDDLFVNNPMAERTSSPMRPGSRQAGLTTPSPSSSNSNSRTSSPDPTERAMRNSRYSVDGIIDPKKLKGIHDLDSDQLAVIDPSAMKVEDSFDRSRPLGPQMFQWNHLGLYAHYAAVGLNGGIQGLSLNFCYFFFKGESNVCANAPSLIFIAWGFKVFYAMFTDSFRPFGMRRKPYMIAGWAMVLLITLIQAFASNSMNARVWLILSILTQIFLMLADVPADGYSVEMGQLEKEDERGQILATGQRIRFFVGIIAGIIQATLLNGPDTNHPDCPISAGKCWSWGLTPNGYYGLLFVLLFMLCIPIYYLEEPSAKNMPLHTLAHHKQLLWDTLCNPTTLYLLIFVVGNGALSAMAPITQTYTQYKLIGLTNFQSGIMSILTNLATMAGIITFQKYFINWNWRYTQYISLLLSANLGLLWLFVYYDVAGLMDPWFTIFLQLNVALSQGLAQVLFAMAVIELAKKGQESTTYEMIVSVANSASLISVIISTQLLTALGSDTCSGNNCSPDQVDISSVETYTTTNGPNRFTNYTFLIYGINLLGMTIFTQFLPTQKKQCAEWKAAGNTFIDSSNPFIAFFTQERVGYASMIVASSVILYNVAASAMLLDPETSCLKAFGGSGC